MKSLDLTGKKIAIGQVTFTSIKIFHKLKRDGIDVKMFFDKDYRLQHKKYNGIPIFPWANFDDVYVILTIPTRYESLKKMLMKDCGYSEDRIIFSNEILFECTEKDVCMDFDWSWLSENTGYVADAFLSNKLSMHSTDETSIVLPRFSIDINNICTLNCRYCFAQMPYYEPEERKNYSIEEVIDGLEKLFKFVDYITYFAIMGGEPLLHPELWKLVSFLNKKTIQDKIGHIDILTNGTLLFSEKTIEEMKKNPLFWKISISPYGIHSSKQYELFFQLNEAGIPYYSRYMTYWQKFGQVKEPESMSEEYIISKCSNCVCRNIHMVHGKLYQCPVLFHFEDTNRIPYDDKNSLDLSKLLTKEELKEYIGHFFHSPGLSWCNANHQRYIEKNSYMDPNGGEMVPVAEQVNESLPCKRYH